MCPNFGFPLRRRRPLNDIGTWSRSHPTCFMCGIYLLNRNPSPNLLCNHVFSNVRCSPFGLVFGNPVGRRMPAFSGSLVPWVDLSGQWEPTDPRGGFLGSGRKVTTPKYVPSPSLGGFVSVHKSGFLFRQETRKKINFSSWSKKKPHKFGEHVGEGSKITKVIFAAHLGEL